MTYDVDISQVDLTALFDLKGSAQELSDWAGTALPPFPTLPNTFTQTGDRKLFWTGEGRWLLRAPIEDEEALLAELRRADAPLQISIVHVSDTLTFFSINGPDAPDVMAIASPLDVHDSVFPANGVSFTEAFGLRALVLRTDGGFELAVDRSFGPMVTEYLARITA